MARATQVTAAARGTTHLVTATEEEPARGDPQRAGSHRHRHGPKTRLVTVALRVRDRRLPFGYGRAVRPSARPRRGKVRQRSGLATKGAVAMPGSFLPFRACGRPTGTLSAS